MKSNFNMLIKNSTKIVLFSLFLLFLINCISQAQSLRGLVNEGVDKYNNKKFNDSEVNFKKGMDKDPNNFNAFFNLGDAQYKQQRYDEAVKTYN
jgi:Ca-activated chloride channel homolog